MPKPLCADNILYLKILQNYKQRTEKLYTKTKHRFTFPKKNSIDAQMRTNANQTETQKKKKNTKVTCRYIVNQKLLPDFFPKIPSKT